MLDEDSTTVDYKEYYKHKDDFMPSMSMCFMNPFTSSTVSEGKKLNHSHLVNYLNGKGTAQMVDLNFENFTDSRQTRYEDINSGDLVNPSFRDIYAPLDGFVSNGGVRVRF